MIAAAALVAEADGRGGTRLARVRSAAPLVWRETPGAVYLVGGAAGPLGGDDLSIDIEVSPGAELTVRTAAASVALPGPSPSRVRVRVEVGAGASLQWLPEPVVAAAGCDHRVTVTVALADGARLVWRDEVVLGRHGEGPGSFCCRLDVHVAGRPLLRHEVSAGPQHAGWDSPAVTGGARAMGSLLVVDPAFADSPRPATPPRGPLLDGASSAVLPLVGPAVQVAALAADARTLRQLLDAWFGPLGQPAVEPLRRRLLAE